MALPWEGQGTLATAEPGDKLVLLSDAGNRFYSSVSPEGEQVGGSTVAKLTSETESLVRRNELKLPTAKDLEAMAGQGTLIVDPTTGEVRVGSKAEMEMLLGEAALGWPKLIGSVEGVLQNAYQSAMTYVPPEGGVHPQGGYVAKTGQYYPPAPQLMPSEVSMAHAKGPELFKKSAFSWRLIYHPFVNTTTDPIGDGSLVAEVVFSPTPMRMYTDHRVMGQIVLPGVSHISLAAAVASVGMEGTGFKRAEFSINLYETFFERPYLVNDGNEIIAMVAAAGAKPGGQNAIPGTEMTYCRIQRVDKEYGGPQPIKI